MSAFLGGIKNSLKLDEVAGGVASKLSSAKEFIQQQQQAVASSGPVKAVKEKMGNLMPPNVVQFSHYLNPTSWTKYFPNAKGNKQSPIDIVASQAQYDETLGDGQFKFTYYPADCIELRNVGFSWMLWVKEDTLSTVTALHLPGTYKLKQIHCHWGTEPMNGSEHLIGGVGYAGEIHIIHFNIKYGTFEEALKHSDGLAVLAVFLNEAHDDNATLEPLIRAMNRIQFKGDAFALPQGYDPRSFIPVSHEYWTYEGSLTTPPCNECVIWTVFRQAIPISSRQVRDVMICIVCLTKDDAWRGIRYVYISSPIKTRPGVIFREIDYSYANKLDAMRSLFAVSIEDSERNPQRLINNVRPPQALNGRPIRASFRSGGITQG